MKLEHIKAFKEHAPTGTNPDGSTYSNVGLAILHVTADERYARLQYMVHKDGETYYAWNDSIDDQEDGEFIARRTYPNGDEAEIRFSPKEIIMPSSWYAVTNDPDVAAASTIGKRGEEEEKHAIH